MNDLPEPQLRFTGIFIPVEILEMEEISMLEMLLLSWIDALFHKNHGGCFASNGHLAKYLKVQENTIAKSLTKLRRLGLIEDVAFNGRTRVIRSKINHIVDERQSNAGLDKNPTWVGKKSNPALDKNPSAHIEERKEERKDKTSAAFEHNITCIIGTPESEQEFGRATFLFSKLKEINPKLATPNFKSWERDLEKMIRVDKRTDEEIHKVLEYIVTEHKTSSSDFTWSKAIQSPEKLRKHFAAICLQMEKSKSIKEKNKPKKLDVEEQLENKLRFKNYIKTNFVKIQSGGFYIEDKADHCRIGNDSVYYNDLKFNELVKHNFKKIGFPGNYL